MLCSRVLSSFSQLSLATVSRREAVRFRACTVTSWRSASCKALVFESFGQPENVVQLQDQPIPEVGSDDVMIDMIACPINPADINLIQGVYPIKPSLPAVGGGEGVGVVRVRGEGVTRLNIGDCVIPALPSLGLWQTQVVSPERNFIKISSSLPVGVASTMFVNPPTAYRMLTDFVNLKPGDCVVQNGGNSGVGLSVIQLAKAWDLNTVNIVRDRPDFDTLSEHMKGLGASEVVTEEFAASHKMKDIFAQYQRPKLALNCVGGKSSAVLAKHLSENGVLVNYGGMSRKPVTIPVGYLIFKNIRIFGYWNSKWLEKNCHSEAHYAMMNDLCELGEQGQLLPPPLSWHKLDEFKSALSNTMKPFSGSKQIIQFDNNY